MTFSSLSNVCPRSESSKDLEHMEVTYSQVYRI